MGGQGDQFGGGADGGGKVLEKMVGTGHEGLGIHAQAPQQWRRAGRNDAPFARVQNPAHGIDQIQVLFQPKGHRLLKLAGGVKVQLTWATNVGVLFHDLVGRRVIILHGFIKKTQATPAKELEIARKRFKEIKHD